MTFFLLDVFWVHFLFLFAYSVLCFCLVASFCFLVLLVLLARAKSICKNKKNKGFKTALITSFNYYLAPFESIGASTFSYLIEEWGYKLLIFFAISTSWNQYVSILPRKSFREISLTDLIKVFLFILLPNWKIKVFSKHFFYCDCENFAKNPVVSKNRSLQN